MNIILYRPKSVCQTLFFCCEGKFEKISPFMQIKTELDLMNERCRSVTHKFSKLKKNDFGTI